MDNKWKIVFAAIIIISSGIGYFTAEMPFRIFRLKIHPYNCQCISHRKHVTHPVLPPDKDIMGNDDIHIDDTEGDDNVGHDVESDITYPVYVPQTNVSSEPEIHKCYCGNGRVKRPVSSDMVEMPDQLCPECGENMPYYNRHIHEDCSNCEGKGYYTIP